MPDRRMRENIVALARATGRSLPTGVDVTTLADVQASRVEWMWPRRIARKKLVVVTGDPGLGKSTLALDVVSRLSAGSPFPDGGRVPIADAVVLTAEDDLADTVRPRLDRQGAECLRVHAITAVHDENGARMFSLTSDLGRLERVVRQRNAGLVVIDPLSAYLGATDSHRDSEVRGLLAPLAALAHETGAAVLAVMHLNKSAQRSALHRTLGSIAFTAAARIVLAVAADPEDPERRLLLPVKSNIGPPAATLAFRIVEGKLVWDDGPVTSMSADEVLARPEDRIAAADETDAARFVRELLADRLRWPRPAAGVLEAAVSAGLSRTAVRVAARRLGVRTKKTSLRSGWTWFLPEGATGPTRSTSSVSSVPSVSSDTHTEGTQETEHTQETEGGDDTRCPSCASESCEDQLECLKARSKVMRDLDDVIGLTDVRVEVER
jgi:hypothetical protein